MKKQLLRLALLLMMLVGIMATTAFASEPLTLTVSDATAMPGEEVTVTISVANNTGLASLQIDVAYDEVLTLTGVTFDSAFGSMVTAPEPYKNPEPLTMISPLSDITANGVFATLTFTVAENAQPGYKANITLSYSEDDIYDGSYTNVPAKVVNGAVTIGGAPAVTLDAPTLTVSNDAATGKNKLAWNEVAGAESYEIWVSTSKNGTYSKLGTVTKTTATHSSATAGKTYYYKVRAIAGDVQGEFSEIVGKTCDLARPTVTAAIDAATGKPTLTWEAVPGADKYEVYVATSKNGTYTKLGSVTGTTATHKAATAGKTYYYRVKAVYSANSGANSAASVAVGKTCDLARPVITVTNNEETGKPVITWKAITGATGYELWASTSKDGTYTKLGAVTGTTATHKGATAGKTYYYKVRAIMSGNSGATSAASAAVGKTCDLARPVVTITLNAKGKPVLSWNAIDGAIGYEIYATTSVNGTYTKLGTVTGTKTTISSAESGKTYYYKVRAICKVSGGNSAYSEIQSVTVE